MSRLSLATSTALATVLSASIAQADVTADDVWANVRAYLDTFGGTLTVQPARNGNTLSTGELALEWTLPMNGGTVRMSESSFDMVELGDGTVELVIPEGFQLHVAVEPTGKPPFSATINLGVAGMTSIASGDPGKVTYTSTVETVTMALADLVVPEVENPDATFTMTMHDVESTQVVEVGSVVSIDTQTTQGAYDFAFRMDDGKGGVMEQSGKATGGTGAFSIVLPRNGMDILNLAAALRDGLTASLSADMQGYETSQVMRMNGQVVQDQTSTVADYKFGMDLQKSGLTFEGTATEMSMKVFLPQVIPLELNLAAANSSGRMALPLSAGDDLQEAALSMDLSGVTVGESLWGLIDPGKTLPRDPATVRLDLTAQVRSYLDWLDFLTVGAKLDAGEEPGELHSVTLNDLTVEAAGASLTGTGAATFDNTDKVTFNGLPKPSGTLDMTLKGANALIEKLQGIGLMSEQDAMGARMGMGMVAKPAPEEGEDVLKSHIELTGEGHVMANGIRLR
ncbi:MAG: DUF2125 domain-containing protein [Pseudooceanicola sp.]|nr:DUF2125 domain-containing protein [Pseudooceanicola sp.]